MRHYEGALVINTPMLPPEGADQPHHMLCREDFQLRKANWLWSSPLTGGSRQGTRGRFHSSAGRGQGVSTEETLTSGKGKASSRDWREWPRQVPGRLGSLKGPTSLKTNSRSHFKQAVTQHACPHLLATMSVRKRMPLLEGIHCQWPQSNHN